MRPFRLRFAQAALLGALLLGPAWLAAQSAPPPAPPQRGPSDTTAPSDTMAKKSDPPPNHVETTLAGFKLSGFAEASYAYSGRSSGDTIVGRLYDRLQSRFMLNALAVVLDRLYDPAKFSAGFHTELLFGQNATLIQSAGFDLGRDAVTADQHGRDLVGNVGHGAHSHEVGHAADQLRGELARVAVEQPPHRAVDPVPAVAIGAVGEQADRQDAP